MLFLPVKLRRLEVAAGGVVLGLSAGAWVTFLVSLLVGMQIGVAIAGLLPLGFVAWALWVFQHRGRWLNFEEGEARPLVSLLESLGLGFLILVSSWLMFTHSFLPGVGGWYSGGYTWADLALHTTLASHFSQVSFIDLQFPIFPGHALSYPFLTDFFSGVLLRLGASFQMAMGLPGILLIAAGLTLSYSVARRLFTSAAVGLIHTWLVLGTASVAGVYYFVQNLRTGQASFLDTVAQFDYSQLPEQFNGAELQVVNFLTSHLLPQRSYLAGFAMVGLLFLLLLQLKKKSSLIWPAGVLLGALPLIHTHSFFVALALVLGLWLHTVVEEKQIKNHWGHVALVAVLFAAPQIYWQLSTTFTEGFARRHSWWMAEEWSGWAFWLRNSGLLVLVLLAAPFIAGRFKMNSFLKVGSLVALGLFIACNVIIFQPNDWDNMKFLSWAFWFGNLFFAWLIWKGATSVRGVWKIATGTLAAVVVLASTASGILAITRDFSADYVLASASDIAFANLVREKTPVDAVILTSNKHNHPVSMLAGRTIVLGYTGWLWSYGISYQERERDVRAVFQGTSQTKSLIKKYDISYIAVASYEQRELGFNASYHLQNGRLVAVTPDGTWQLFAVDR